MTLQTNFFASFDELSQVQISDDTDRNEAKRKINKSLNKLFKRCSDSVDSYDIYDKMFDILASYDKREFKKTKLKKSEFKNIVTGQKTSNDSLIKSILNLAGKDQDNSSVSLNEIKDECLDYFQSKNDTTDNKKNNNSATDKIVGHGAEDKKLEKKYKKLKKAGFSNDIIFEMLDNNCKVKKAIKYKEKGVKESTIASAILNNYSVKDVLKLQKLNLTNDDINKITTKYNATDVIAMIKYGAATFDAIDSALSRGMTADSIEEYKDALVYDEYIVDAISGKRECFLPLDNDYSIINKLYHGERLDSSLEDWIINVNGKEVKIETDNDMYTQEYAQENGVPQYGQVLSNRQKKLMQKALEQMGQMGQEVPEKIYLTNVIPPSYGGFFESTDPNAVVVANCLGYVDDDFYKHIFYHESAHMKDYNLGKDNFLSCKKDICEINSEKESIDFKIKGKNYSIKTSKIEKIIGNYSLSNNQEFVAEVTALLTSGKILKKEDGTYIFATKDGKYKNPRLNSKKFTPTKKDIQALNKVMKLYNALVGAKIVKPKAA